MTPDEIKLRAIKLAIHRAEGIEDTADPEDFFGLVEALLDIVVVYADQVAEDHGRGSAAMLLHGHARILEGRLADGPIT